MSNIKEKLQNKTIFIILLTILGCIFCLVYLSLYGNEPQKYTDIVVEYTAAFLANKSAELHLVYILIFGGIILYALHHLLACGQQKNNALAPQNNSQLSYENILWAGGFLLMAIVNYLVYSGSLPTFVFLAITIGFLYLFAKDKIVSGIILYWLSYYAIVACYRIYAFCGGKMEFNYTIVNIGAFVATLVIVLTVKSAKKLYLVGLGMQLLIPSLWLIYFQNLYAQTDDADHIINSYIFKPEKPVYIFVLFMLFACLAEIVLVYIDNKESAKKNKLKNNIANNTKNNIANNIENAITRGTCISIMMFNQFFGSGAVMPADMRHPYENVIGFQQVFRLLQKPFDEYVPVSGMYSLVHGAIFQLFGKGLFANYYISTNVFYALVIVLIIVLLSFHLDKKYVFLLALCLPIMDYNRVAFIMPTMLLLTLPKLLDKPNAWLRAWMLSSLFMGLYYPLFGVAVCASFVPMAIAQIVEYKSSGKLAKDIKSVKFYIGWIICFIPVIAAIPWLIGLAGQILSMANQSIYADGLARFGQTMPGNLVSYMKEYQGFQIALYQLLSFMIPIILVWICGFLAVDYLKRDGKKIQLERAKVKEFSAIFSGVIMATISFSYTFVRLDINDVYSRSLGVLVAVIALLIVYSQRYLKDEKVKLVVTLFALCVPIVSGVYGFKESPQKLKAYYTIPEGYVYADHWDVANLGVGFVNGDTWKKMSAAKEAVANVPENTAMFGFSAQYGPTYIYDMKGFATIEHRTVRGYGAAKACVELIKKHKPVIGNAIEPFNNYYLYHWLMTSGYYSYSRELGMFVPNDEKKDIEDVIYENGNAGSQREVLDIGNFAASLGTSLDTLMPNFTDVTPYISLEMVGDFAGIQFEDEIFGNDADFLYIKLANDDTEPLYALYNTSGGFSYKQENLSGKSWMKKIYNAGKKVLIGWSVGDKDYFICCNVNNGELLIPLGAGTDWLLYDHDCVWVTFENSEPDVKAPQIESVKMLKLREIE